jgi:hypothetical protein
MASRLLAAAIFCLIVVGSSSVGRAQNIVHRSGTAWPELQVEYVFKSTSYLYFRNQYRHNFDPDLNHLYEAGPLKYLERVQFRAGFEHMFNNHWSGGIAEAYAIERTRKILFNEIYLRHLSSLGTFRITQRASIEHIVQWGRSDLGRVRLRADIDREIKLGSLNLRPRIGYELFFNIDYLPTEQSRNTQRRVDRTRLRFEILCPLTGHLAITPFFTRQSDFLIVEPAYDANNNLIRSGGKRSYVTPIMGLDLRYAIFKGGKPFPRVIKINR